MNLSKEDIILVFLRNIAEAEKETTFGEYLASTLEQGEKLADQLVKKEEENSGTDFNPPYIYEHGTPEISIKPGAIHRAEQEEIKPDFNKPDRPAKLSDKQKIVLDKVISMTADALPVTINALAEELGEEHKNAYYLMTALKNKGYLESYTNPNGRGHIFTPLKNLDGSDFDPVEKDKQQVKTPTPEEKKIPFDQAIGKHRYEDDPRAIHGEISCKTILNS